MSTFNNIFKLNLALLLGSTIFIAGCAGSPNYIGPTSGKVSKIRLSGVLPLGSRISFNSVPAFCKKRGGEELARLGKPSAPLYPSQTESSSIGMPITLNRPANEIYREVSIPAGQPINLYAWSYDQKYGYTESCEMHASFTPKEGFNYEARVSTSGLCRINVSVIDSSGKSASKPEGIQYAINEGCK